MLDRLRINQNIETPTLNEILNSPEDLSGESELPRELRFAARNDLLVGEAVVTPPTIETKEVLDTRNAMTKTEVTNGQTEVSDAEAVKNLQSSDLVESSQPSGMPAASTTALTQLTAEVAPKTEVTQQQSNNGAETPTDLEARLRELEKGIIDPQMVTYSKGNFVPYLKLKPILDRNRVFSRYKIRNGIYPIVGNFKTKDDDRHDTNPIDTGVNVNQI